MTITEFLLARIAEDESEANAALSGQADPENGWGVETYQGNPGFTISPHVGHIHEAIQAEHVVKWNPAHVLAECAAKRAIVKMFAEEYSETRDGLKRQTMNDTEFGRTLDMERTLSHLAAVYADHPDYDPAWSL